MRVTLAIAKISFNVLSIPTIGRPSLPFYPFALDAKYLKGELSGSNKLRNTGRVETPSRFGPSNGRALRLLLVQSRYLRIARLDLPIGASSFLMNSNYRLYRAGYRAVD
jgi:hypothetical protein